MSAKLFLMALGLGLVGLGVSQAKAPLRDTPHKGHDRDRSRHRSAIADGTETEEGAAEAPSPLTEAFVRDATMAEIYDVQAARIALNKGQNADLRAFAAQVIKDHNDAAGALKAATGGVPEPKALDREHQGLIDRLNEISEHDFDALYLELQAKGQESAEAAFVKFSGEAPNEALRAFADKLLTAIRHRQDSVRSLMP
jgi:putative membrane protein